MSVKRERAERAQGKGKKKSMVEEKRFKKIKKLKEYRVMFADGGINSLSDLTCQPAMSLGLRRAPHLYTPGRSWCTRLGSDSCRCPQCSHTAGSAGSHEEPVHTHPRLRKRTHTDHTHTQTYTPTYIRSNTQTHSGLCNKLSLALLALLTL